MNILLITPSLPSALNRIRALNILRQLAQHHRVFLFSLTKERNPDVSSLRQYCAGITTIHQPFVRSFVQCAISLPTLTPMEIAYCRNAAARRSMGEILSRERIDLVYVKRLRTLQYIDRNNAVPVIVDTTDAMSRFYENAARNAPLHAKPFYWREYTAYRDYERRMLAQWQDWIVSSDADRKYLQELSNGAARIHCIPNGVDTKTFQYRGDTLPDKPFILFSGLMDKFVNIEAAHFFVRDVFGHIRAAIPDATLMIVGPNPARSIRRLADKNIVVTGFVEDINEWIAQSRVVVCPIRTGAGTRNKILQAWSVGRPVVATPKGIEGLDAKDNVHALIHDNPRAFADAVVHLLSDDTPWRRLVPTSRKLVEERYDMNVIGQKLNALLHSIGQ